MTDSLHNILADIATLPTRDQRWILNQLSAAQIRQLKHHQGLALLKSRLDATAFTPTPVVNEEEILPPISRLLAQKSPLYAAIILEQENYPWRHAFLQTCDKEKQIQRALATQTADLKLAVKEAIAQEWQEYIAFEISMEQNNG